MILRCCDYRRSSLAYTHIHTKNKWKGSQTWSNFTFSSRPTMSQNHGVWTWSTKIRFILLYQWDLSFWREHSAKLHWIENKFISSYCRSSYRRYISKVLLATIFGPFCEHLEWMNTTLTVPLNDSILHLFHFFFSFTQRK